MSEPKYALTYIEIDLDYCSLTYGSSPCAAAIGVTGESKCYNTKRTCQDRPNFDNAPVTLRFAMAAPYRPHDIDVVAADVTDVSYSPGRISLGEDLGTRSTLTVSFEDHRSTDTGPGGDKYLSDRDYNPYTQGTYWGKFRARQTFLRGRPLRWIQGVVGQALGDMETRHFIVESFEGPRPDGSFSITAKDALKSADGDRAQAPALSRGKLVGDISDTDFLATLTPAGIGAEDYQTSGWINIGGKEIVAFTRDAGAGDDANTKLLLHADGVDAATTITDSSASARTVTVNGNLQLDTAWKKFGLSSMLFDGTGDYATVPDHADWAFGTASFTVDAWLRISSLAVQRTIFCQQTDANNRQQLFVTTAGAIGFTVTSASSTIITLTSANGIIAINTDYHVALVRNGTSFVIYVNGVSVATATDSDSIPNYTGAFTIGMQGTTTNPMLGWLDEFRVSSVARWTAAFEVPIAPYAESGDVLYLSERGAFDTEPTTHKAGDRCQQCLYYQAQDPADVVYDLFGTYAGIDPAVMPLANWQAETAAYYRRVVTALISEPTPVNKLVAELVQQCGLAIWWDDLEREIRLQVLREITTTAKRFDRSNVVEETLNPREQPQKRISQIWTFFGLKTPLHPLEEPSSYRSMSPESDLDAEEDAGKAVKKIFSRWIPFGGSDAADRVNQLQLGRYLTAPRVFPFHSYKHATVRPILGEGARLLGQPMQDYAGAEEDVPVQIVRINPKAGVYEVEAEEQLFVDLGEPEDLNTHTITIDSNSYDIDLRVLHDTIHVAPVAGNVIELIVNAGVIVGSTSNAHAGLIVGTWPTSATTGNRTSGNPTLTGIADTTGLFIGQRVFGTGIPAGAKIASIVVNTSITLDMNASSGSGTSTALTVHAVIINVRLRGRIQAKGGNGGKGGGATTALDGLPGEVGGLALYSRYAINLFLDTGDAEIWGGGGGGGGASKGYSTYGNGGGGGAGSVPGSGGAIGGVSGGFPEYPGAPGTTEAGGLGGVGTYPSAEDWAGGNGGNPAQAGTAGGSYGGGYTGGVGGAAGGAIDGVSYLVKTGTGDIRGTQVN